MASNPLDNLLGQAESAQERLEHSLQVAQLVSVDDDGRTGTAQGLGGNWSVAARLWQPRLAVASDHIHTMPEHTTTKEGSHRHGAPPSSGEHTHKVDELKTESAGEHTHEVEYRVGDRGILLRLRNGVAIFLGGL